MRSFVVALVFILCPVCLGQTNYFAYKNYRVQPIAYDRIYGEGGLAATVVDESPWGEYSFPIFSNPNNKYAAAKINQMLQISELEVLKGFEKKSLFEVVSYDGGGIYGGKDDISFRIQSNNSKVLSIELNQSACGATCNWWTTYYNFNSGNGDVIQLKDLFTETGYKKFFRFATKRRVAQLKREIRKKGEGGDFEEFIGCYEQDDDRPDFYIKNNALYIDGESCLIKAVKVLGFDTSSKFKLAEFKNYLNAYGKSLFSLTKLPIKNYRAKFLPQLFQGTIAGQNVVLVLNSGFDNEMRGEYVYSKYGKGISLEGTINEGELTLTEKIVERNETGLNKYFDNGFIKANFNGWNIVGTWTDKDKAITHNFSLIRK